MLNARHFSPLRKPFIRSDRSKFLTHFLRVCVALEHQPQNTPRTLLFLPHMPCGLLSESTRTKQSQDSKFLDTYQRPEMSPKLEDINLDNVNLNLARGGGEIHNYGIFSDV